MNEALSYRREACFSSLDNTNLASYIVLFILWPFLAFILALINYSEKNAKIVVYCFIIYYGMSFDFSNAGMDSYRYAQSFMQASHQSFYNFFETIGGGYGETEVDIVEPFLAFVVSRFTSSPAIYFAVWAGFMGFFYLKSINLLYERYQRNPNINALILLVYFVFTKAITDVAGIRMPTAMWMFFLAAYHIILYRDKRYFLLSFFACFVHWSFITVNAVLFIYFVLGNRNLLYLPLVIASFILPNLLEPLFSLLANTMGGAFLDRYQGYSSEGHIQDVMQMRQSVSWFITLMHEYTIYFFVFGIAMIQLFARRLMNKKYEQNLYSFILLFLAFVNFGKIIPSFGGRFQVLFFMFATLYLFLYFLKSKRKSLSYINIVGLFPMLVYILVTLRIGSETINAWIFNPLLGISLLLPGISLIELIF